jgi:hypothetical protein
VIGIDILIPMSTNCAPLLADLFLYSYESEFLQNLVKDKKIHEARTCNKNIAMVVTSGGANAHPSGMPDCIQDVSGVRVAKIFSF